MKYFRYYPWGMQLLLFVLMMFTLISFGSFLVFSLMPRLTPYSITQLEHIDSKSPAALVNVALLVQGFLSLFIFLVPALLFAHLAHPEPGKYLGLRAPGKWIQLVLVIFMMLGATPVLQLMEGWISHIDFGAKVKATQAANDNMMEAFLKMPDFPSFLLGFLVMAIIPAVGEEVFFRGLMLRFVKKKSSTMLLPVLFTATLFAYSHSNIYGLLSIFLAGILLAVIYNLTGSLWCSIVAHMFFNGLQVVISYLSNGNIAIKTAQENTIPIAMVVAGLIVFSVSFYLLLKNKTPLPANWTDDFTVAELSRNSL